MNWAVQDKDTIFDIHDLYYHYKFVESWEDLSDTLQIRKELENLQIAAKIYYITEQNICEDGFVINYEAEQSLVYWQNTKQRISICDYLNYQDSKNLKKLYLNVLRVFVIVENLYLLKLMYFIYFNLNR